MKKHFVTLLGFSILLLILKLFTFSTTVNSRYGSKDSFGVSALVIPEDLNFAGEQVPLEDFEVYERFDRELLINTYWQSNTLLMHKRANRWFPVIEPILKKYGVPNDFKYVPLVETGMMNLVSPASAVGFWQILEGTGKEYGLIINSEVDERYHVEKSTEVACKYFLAAYKEFGSWTMAAASYNMGISGLRNQVNRQKQKVYYDILLNQETARYVLRIVSIKEIISHPEQYGYHFRKKDLYNRIPTTKIAVDSSISDLADFARQQNISYKTLKTFNPWLRDNLLKNTERKTFFIELPQPEYKNTSPYPGEAINLALNASPVEKTEIVIADEDLPVGVHEKIHLVKKGESLTQLAKKYKVTVPEIIEWNNLNTPELRDGQRIVLIFVKAK